MVSPPKEERTILDAIRRGTAPTVVKRQASRGTGPVAAEELLEILVFLTNDPDPTCSETAKQTLNSWPEEKYAELLSHPQVSSATLAYFAARAEPSEALTAVLASHPNADDAVLGALATRLTVEQIQEIVEDEARIAKLPYLVGELLRRSDLPSELSSRVEAIRNQQVEAEKKAAEAPAAEAQPQAKAEPEEERERVSLTQKVARMSVSERVQLALKGNKDERLILIRDPSKVVYRAVLSSPKLSDQDVEAFATMKNIADEALRIMASTRKFLKNYVVVRNLINNPRTPLDVSLKLINRLTEKDLKFLTLNRNVPETLRTMAVRMLRQKSSGH